MANFGKRPQPYRIQFPITAPQVEQIDEMFEILFKRIGQVQTELINTSGVATSAANATMSLLSEVTMAGSDDARLEAIGQTGATGAAGRDGIAFIGPPEEIEPPPSISLTGSLTLPFTLGSVLFMGPSGHKLSFGYRDKCSGF